MPLSFKPGRTFGSALLFVALAGCAGPQLRELAPRPIAEKPAVELTQTPFFPQEIHQCGPAALATVLTAAGVSDASPEALASEVYIPGREGSLQTELIAAARRHGRLAVKLSPNLDAALATVAAGQPVLLLQNLGLKRWPRWHYAVLVGYDDARHELILRSGRTERERLSVRRFMQTWTLAERWAVVIAEPASPPAAVNAADWIAAAAPYESLGQTSQASAAYEAAVNRWPQEPLAWLAVANTRYAAKELAGAQTALEQAVTLKPEPAALNNLAQVYADRGCRARALETLDRIVAPPVNLTAAVADTRAAAEKLSPSISEVCG